MHKHKLRERCWHFITTSTGCEWAIECDARTILEASINCIIAIPLFCTLSDQWPSRRMSAIRELSQQPQEHVLYSKLWKDEREPNVYVHPSSNNYLPNSTARLDKNLGSSYAMSIILLRLPQWQRFFNVKCVVMPKAPPISVPLVLGISLFRIL